MFVPPLRHWYLKGPVPVALTLKLAEFPARARTLTGCVVILGGTFTTNPALPLVTLLIALAFNPAMDGAEVPGWFAGLTALGLFMYSTMDNMDGKQARRTGTSSALGHLFDHGEGPRGGPWRRRSSCPYLTTAPLFPQGWTLSTRAW